MSPDSVDDYSVLWQVIANDEGVKGAIELFGLYLPELATTPQKAAVLGSVWARETFQ